MTYKHCIWATTNNYHNQNNTIHKSKQHDINGPRSVCRYDCPLRVTPYADVLCNERKQAGLEIIIPYYMSRPMGKPTICKGENKGADQLRGNREADQRLCFRYSDSTIPPLLNSKMSSFKLFSVTVQAGLCRTCSETTLLVFPRGGSYINPLITNGLAL